MPESDEKKSQQILINVTPSTYEMLRKVATIEKRKLGYVARELMIKGLDQYAVDGDLEVPVSDDQKATIRRVIQEELRRAFDETLSVTKKVVSHPSSKPVVEKMIGLGNVEETDEYTIAHKQPGILSPEAEEEPRRQSGTRR